MPKITVYPDGCKAAKAAGMNRNPPPRGNATGWSKATARRNADFLMSIDSFMLADGVPVSLSLTFGRGYPVTPALMKRTQAKFFDRLRWRGLIRLHWLIEFQRDGTPHMHGIAYFPAGEDPEALCAEVRNVWLSCAEWSGCKPPGQYVAALGRLKGWKIYLAKHGARGVNHYQRQMPEGWEKPGRMWGHLGEWPRRSVELEVDLGTFFRFRRFIRSARVAQARKAVLSDPTSRDARRSLRAARRSLQEGEAGSSAWTSFRNVSQWLPEADTVRWLRCNYITQTGALMRLWEKPLGTYANTDSQKALSDCN